MSPARADQEGPSSSCAATEASTRLRSSVKPGSRSCAVACTTSTSLEQSPCTIRLRKRAGWRHATLANSCFSSSDSCAAASPSTVKFHSSASRRMRSAARSSTATPSTNATAWTAAWIISSRSRTSRRIQGLSLRQYRCAQTLVQRRPRHQVDRPSEQLRQLVRQVLDLPAEPPTGLELIEDVHVTRRFGRPTCHRTEYHQSGHAIPRADGSQPRLVHRHTRHYHPPRLSPARTPGRPASGAGCEPDPATAAESAVPEAAKVTEGGRRRPAGRLPTWR